MDTTGPSTDEIGLRGGRLWIGVMDGVFGRSQASAGGEGETAAIGNAIYRGGAGLRVRTVGGDIQSAVNTGAHGKVTSNGGSSQTMDRYLLCARSERR